MKFLMVIFCLCSSFLVFAQNKPQRFSFDAGYGAAGSFFVRSYDELNDPVLGGAYYKKSFVGSNLHFAVGYKTGKKSTLNLGYTRQQFKRRIMFTNNQNIFVNSNIRHINNFFELWYTRTLMEKQKTLLAAGIGIYYIQPQQEEVNVATTGITWEERNYKYNKLEDGGAFIEFKYEYKFQPRVNIGLKTQFYFTISTGMAESITLYPYIRLLF